MEVEGHCCPSTVAASRKLVALAVSFETTPQHPTSIQATVSVKSQCKLANERRYRHYEAAKMWASCEGRQLPPSP